MENSEDNEALSGRLVCLKTYKVYNLSQSKMEGKWTIGRHPTNDLVLLGARISNHHCYLVFRPGFGFVLTDVSSNGSRVNGMLVGHGKCLIVRPGYTILLGNDENLGARLMYYRKPPLVLSSSIWNMYTRGAELGRGTFGSVHKCLERTTGLWYAVKMIDRTRFGREEAWERMFKREIDVLKRVNSKHDHIVQFKETFDERNTLYIVLEYVGGGDLSGYLDRQPALPEDTARELTRQICKGVRFIHDQGVAHRDLKPENILLTTDEPPKVKIADFGLSKMIDGTFLKTQCGTPDYLAPEVVSHSGQGYDIKVDSWSVGVIVFLMLTKSLPFHRDSAPNSDIWVSVSQRTMDLRPLLNLNCSRQCVAFVRSLLREDPARRRPIWYAMRMRWTRMRPAVLLPVITSPEDGLEVTGNEPPEAVPDEVSFSMKVPGAYPRSFI